MTAPAAPRRASTLPLPFVAPQQQDDQAEAVILALCAGYYGQDGHGAGLLVRREGRFCTPMCPRGQWLQPGDSLRGGQPCSARCRQIAEAIERAAEWLQGREERA